jgi:hypothetical protein
VSCARACLALVLVACGSEGHAPPPSSAPPTSASPTSAPPSSAPSTSAPPSAIAPPPPTSASPTLPGGHAGAPTGGPAFVITFRRSDYPTATRATLIVPFDAATPVRSIDGIVVQDESVSPPRLRWLLATADGPLPCATDCARACTTGDADEIVLGVEGSSATPSGDCRCYPPIDPRARFQDEDEDDPEHCSSAGGDPASIVGGRVFVPLDTHDGCGGYNRYGADLRTVDLTTTSWSAPSSIPQVAACQDASSGGWVGFAQYGAPTCRRDTDGWETADPTDDDDVLECQRCADGEPDGIVPRISHRELRLVGWSVDVSGSGLRWDAHVALSAASCPSANDPCGPASAFPALGDDDDEWIATDGAHALVLVGDDFRRSHLRLLSRATDAARPDLPVPFDANDVLGVRVHADARLLAELADRGLPDVSRPVACTPASAPSTIALAADDEGFVDTHEGSDWGNRCATHLHAGELDAAEAACARGLAMATRGSTRGAIEYNLGRIAEARGDRALARAHYAQSLVDRPGNATVQAAIDALAPP